MGLSQWQHDREETQEVTVVERLEVAELQVNGASPSKKQSVSFQPNTHKRRLNYGC